MYSALASTGCSINIYIAQACVDVGFCTVYFCAGGPEHKVICIEGCMRVWDVLHNDIDVQCEEGAAELAHRHSCPSTSRISVKLVVETQ